MIENIIFDIWNAWIIGVCGTNTHLTSAFCIFGDRWIPRLNKLYMDRVSKCVRFGDNRLCYHDNESFSARLRDSTAENLIQSFLGQNSICSAGVCLGKEFGIWQAILMSYTGKLAAIAILPALPNGITGFFFQAHGRFSIIPPSP